MANREIVDKLNPFHMHGITSIGLRAAKRSIGFLFFAIFLALSSSCKKDYTENTLENALELAGENRTELEKVIAHYQGPEDSLKLKAARFLIMNMRYQYHRPLNTAQRTFVEDVENTFEDLGLGFKDSLYNFNKWYDNLIPAYKFWGPQLTAKWDSIGKTHSRETQREVMDISTVSADLLIDNIDFSFKAWENAPWKEHVDFDRFCKSILPYRNFHDIPENNLYGLTSSLSHEKRGGLLETAHALNHKINFKLLYHSALLEFSHMSLSDVLKTKHATCRQLSSVKIASLRALGIPCDQVFAVDGTSWVRIWGENGKIYDYENAYITDKQKDGTIGHRRHEPYAKVYMRTFDIQPNPFNGVRLKNIPPFFRNPNLKDVSNDHLETYNLEVEIESAPPRETQLLYLCIFNKKQLKWSAVDWAKIEKGKARFPALGKNKIYYPAYYLGHKHYPAAAPFYLDDLGNVIRLKAGKSVRSVKLRRKRDWNYIEHKFAGLAVGMWFEGSNDSLFSDPGMLGVISEKPTHFQEVKLNADKKYRYFRMVDLDTAKLRMPILESGMHLAELVFLDKDNQPVPGRSLSMDSVKQREAKNLFDGDIRTNFDITNRPGWVGIDAGRPVHIAKAKYLIRNSFNTVEAGDTYELFYWDDEWKSLGEKKAEKDYIEFSTPENAVLWLRNRTKGKEEMIFFIKDGIQVWG